MKKTILLLLIAVSLMKTTGSFAQATNVQDSLALVDLYDSTGGAAWQNPWTLTTPVSTWYGVTVTAGRVTAVGESGNELSGTLSPSLGDLSALTFLNLDNNFIGGGIPSSLSTLSNLTELDLNLNQLSGSIPSSLGNLSNLTALNLDINQLSGSIPTSLGSLSNLTDLDLSYNQLSGGIPTQLGNLSNLNILKLSYNQLSGTIPTQLGSLANLQILSLYANQFTGSIPSSLGSLSNLQELYLYQNQLTGNLPTELGSLSNLTTLSLGDNQLSGSIPSSFGGLSNLAYLYLFDNQLTGSIPSSLGNLSNLIFVYLYNNQLSGTIPSSLDNFTTLNYLDISTNNLTFDGMEGIATAYNFANYSPQAFIPIDQNGNTLSVSAGGTLTNNTYNWYNGGTLVATNTGDSTYTVTAIGNYSVAVTNSIATQLTLYSDTIDVTTLPVKILSFTATKEGKQSLLQWTTSQEVNSNYFAVERSNDGLNFSGIGSVAARGNTVASPNYTFTDDQPKNGTNYYRLRLVDKDGKYSYSQVRNIYESISFAASIYPNPVQTNLNLNFTSNSAATVQIEIVNAEGKTITSQQIQLVAGSSTQTINTSSLSNGTYYVRCITTDGVTQMSFVKAQ